MCECHLVASLTTTWPPVRLRASPLGSVQCGRGDSGHSNLRHWTWYGPHSAWYYSFSRTSHWDPRNAFPRTSGNEEAAEWCVGCARAFVGCCWPGWSCTIRMYIHLCTHTICHMAETYGTTISSSKNIYQLYKVRKKKVLQLQSVSFVLRSFIYQCYSNHRQLGHNSKTGFLLDSGHKILF